MKAIFLGWLLAAAISVAPAIAAEDQDADNTGKNVRDRGGESLTPMDQGRSAADRELTAQIRQAIVSDDEMSIQAQNVKIITIDGSVTLRGPVESAAEKATVAAKAKQIAGVKHVDDQLEIDSQ